MKLVIFGLSISSSWGNGHATLWRGLCRALASRGHCIVFFERDVPYYAAHRDLTDVPGTRLVLYPDWESVTPAARRELSDADVGMVTSYCPDGVAASELLFSSSAGLRTFYDLDTPITFSQLDAGRSVSYIGPRAFRDFDLVLSYTGGSALTELQERLGAKRVAALYGSVDPDVHRRVAALSRFESDLSYLGTYAEDRQDTLERLFVEPAHQMPQRKFLIGGALYPQHFPWAANIFFVRHLPPAEHPAFYSSSALTLNVTRRAMACMGYCPSGRLFEAAACATPVLTDDWEGLAEFFEPGSEILIAKDTDDVLTALSTPKPELEQIGRRARERALDCHTAEHRARELETILGSIKGTPARAGESAAEV